ncbi:MAG: FAD/NAD(P)-binding oxidoreductase [Desulfatiglandaceae bacterium]|jgi:NADPH-dependent 2,4-dienoyl-CoA reductase/sulfur reductase-like enzyme
MKEEHFIIIGMGPSGTKAAITLRKQAPEARITILSKDAERAFTPHMLPDFIAGKILEKDLYPYDPSTWDDLDIHIRRCQRVTDVSPGNGHLLLDHREVLRFTGLILAVGGRPQIPEPYLPFQDLMSTLKTVKDAKQWIEKLEGVDSVLVIGGDLTSLAVAKALLHLGKKVFFLINEDAFWPLRYDMDLMRKVSERLSQGGVEVIPSGKLGGLFRNANGKTQVRIDDRTLQVGMVGTFFGLAPDIRFLARSGFSMDRGILVDEYLNTGFEGIYATGDCAQVYHPGLRDYWVSIGYENALNLGRIAALNLAGRRVQAKVSGESIFKVRGVNVNTSWWVEF